jgi:hypothetical protein
MEVGATVTDGVCESVKVALAVGVGEDVAVGVLVAVGVALTPEIA